MFGWLKILLPPATPALLMLFLPYSLPAAILASIGVVAAGAGILILRRHAQLRKQHVECAARQDQAHRRLGEMQGRIDVLTAEREISLILNESLDFEKIMERVLNLAGEALAVRDNDSLQLYLKNGQPQPVLIAERTRGATRCLDVARDDAIVSLALQRAGIVMSVDEEKVQMAAPLTHDRELIGAMKLQLSLRGTTHIRQERMQFLNENIAELAKFMSLAIKTRDLYSKAVQDALTGLATKRHFVSQLEMFVGLAKRHGEPLSLIMVDIDHFKKVNDTHGHLTGDLVLREVAQILQKNMRRRGDLAHSAYRYGGEEMSIILPKTSREQAEEVAGRIRKAVEAKAFRSHKKQILRATVSLGVALLDEGMAGPTELVAAADAALYKAKQTGRNRVVVA